MIRDIEALFHWWEKSFYPLILQKYFPVKTAEQNFPESKGPASHSWGVGGTKTLDRNLKIQLTKFGWELGIYSILPSI